MRHLRPLGGACALSPALLLFPSIVGLAAPPLPTATVPLPPTNVTGGGPAVSSTLLAYNLPDPVLAPTPNQAATFLNFHARIFVVPLQARGGRVVAGPPRLLFTGPRGMGIGLVSTTSGWLVYEQYSASDLTAPWTLAARDLATGRVVTVDTSLRGGVPGIPPLAASDGRTIVWATRTQLPGGGTTRVHSYDLRTGRFRVIAEGGSPSTWQYDWPAISGHYAVFEKDTPARQTAQVFLADLTTGQVRPLTPAAEANSEPAISGDVVVWKRGWRYADGTGAVIYNRRTGRQQSLREPEIEQPKATAGRYVVFPTNQPGQPIQVQSYDLQTGTRTTLAGPTPTHDGYQPGNTVFVGDHAVLSVLVKLSPTTTPNGTRLVVTLMP